MFDPTMRQEPVVADARSSRTSTPAALPSVTGSRQEANVAFAGRLRERYLDRGTPLDLRALTRSPRVRAILGGFASAFPGARFEITSATVDDERVVFAGRFSGTHDGPWRGISATGRHVRAAFMISLRCADGEILDVTTVADSLAIAQQLGVAPPLGPKACELPPTGSGH
jgi:ketosteroid isomerase-like protein